MIDVVISTEIVQYNQGMHEVSVTWSQVPFEEALPASTSSPKAVEGDASRANWDIHLAKRHELFGVAGVAGDYGNCFAIW